MLLRNEGGNRNHSLLISMKGVADNKSAIGAKVEVFADGVWQKFEMVGGFRLSQPGSAAASRRHRDSAEHADMVRILWPTGVPQDETEVGTKNTLAVTGAGPPGQLLSHTVCLERYEIRIYLRRDRRRSHWPLGIAHGKKQRRSG